jgi:uncharacterized membrane protein
MNSPSVPPEGEDFYLRAYARIARFMLVAAVLAAAALVLAFGWRVGAGFALGAAIAVLNFYWLKRTVGVLADRVTRPGSAKPGRGVLVRFGLRYVLVALAAYAIFRSSSLSLHGLLAGLLLPVAAIMCEAAYETYVALRRGT